MKLLLFTINSLKWNEISYQEFYEQKKNNEIENLQILRKKHRTDYNWFIDAILFQTARRTFNYNKTTVS